MMKSFVGFLIAILICVSKAKSFKISPKTLCKLTPHPTNCYPLIEHSKYVTSNESNDPLLLYKNSILLSINEVSRLGSQDFSKNGTLSQSLRPMIPENTINLQLALQNCRDCLSLALFNLNLSIPTTTPTAITSNKPTIVDFKIWLSATISDFQTCIDGFEYASDEAKTTVLKTLDNSTKLVRNSLSILWNIGDNNDRRGGARDVGPPSSSNWPVPSWLIMSDHDEKFITNNNIYALVPDLVVAADGSGDYMTINEAIKAVPENKYETRFVVYVKKGIYFENVKVERTKWNVMMFGDGMDQTIISGNLSNCSGLPTAMTATFAVDGPGFIARDMAFRNTAGPENRQAVALSSTSDKSIFYRCSMDGYQDTLFTRSSRQFYRECNISGTVDIIFGASAVVIQNSTILVKKPLHGQGNMITAQGKSSPDIISGISIQFCTVIAAEDDLGGARTFLGRPWQNYSTVVFMESFLDGLIDPAGWSEWRYGVEPPETIYYGEYNNRGPGSGVDGRVKWSGVRVNFSVDEVRNFTVREFISGMEWLPGMGVPFYPDLSIPLF